VQQEKYRIRRFCGKCNRRVRSGRAGKSKVASGAWLSELRLSVRFAELGIGMTLDVKLPRIEPNAQEALSRLLFAVY